MKHAKQALTAVALLTTLSCMAQETDKEVLDAGGQ